MMVGKIMFHNATLFNHSESRVYLIVDTITVL